MIERRWADRPAWAPDAEGRFTMIPVSSPEFSGLVTLTELARVDVPRVATLAGREVVLAADGYALLTHFPHAARHVIATIFDADSYIVLWWVSLCREHGLDERLVPWYDDLRAHVVVLPDGMVLLRDEEALDAAVAEGALTPEERALARQELRQLVAALEEGLLPGMALSMQHLHALREVAAGNAASEAAGGQPPAPGA